MSLPAGLIDFGYRQVLRPLLFRVDPEVIHEQMIRKLSGIGSTKPALATLRAIIGNKGRPVEVAGINFPSRVGLAAGLDKDGTACRTWAGLGFGFAELGTVTAFPQPGNDKPRIFRAVESQGLINRMGFNNAGAAEMAKFLAKAGIFRGNLAAGIPVGISIGKSRIVAVEDAALDYLTSMSLLVPHADYLAINISSPNTPKLRSLQEGNALVELVKALVTRATKLTVGQHTTPVPIFVKVAPDVTVPQLDEIIQVSENAGIAGLIATNTTLGRDQLTGSDQSLAAQAGGLSGAPLTLRARAVVKYLAEHTSLPIMGVGGVMTPDDAKVLLDTGASLVQLYTGFIYAGPALAMRINAEDRRNT